ncbi:MAG: hypothetical protein MMC33_005208 [Icmadophila ericetorum]|nr:hypothetical protein [Icmadophila ericetorum]
MASTSNSQPLVSYQLNLLVPDSPHILIAAPADPNNITPIVPAKLEIPVPLTRQEIYDHIQGILNNNPGEMRGVDVFDVFCIRPSPNYSADDIYQAYLDADRHAKAQEDNKEGTTQYLRAGPAPAALSSGTASRVTPSRTYAVEAGFDRLGRFKYWYTDPALDSWCLPLAANAHPNPRAGDVVARHDVTVFRAFDSFVRPAATGETPDPEGVKGYVRTQKSERFPFESEVAVEEAEAEAEFKAVNAVQRRKANRKGRPTRAT